jgi:hypothetical protein
MSNDDDSQTGLNYELLVEDALRSVVRSSLRIVENIGLPGETHFYISFITGYEGVEIDKSLRAKHPDQMTIVIQHQYADLRVAEDHFGITLFFDGKPSQMIIPFQAVTSLNDPSVGFGLQFGMLDENDAEDDGTASDASISPANLKSNASDNKSDDAGSDGKSPKDDKTAEVVSLDTFRKRPTQ